MTGEQWLANEEASRASSAGSSNTIAVTAKGGFIEKFEKIAEEDQPFLYPIRFINPD